MPDEKGNESADKETTPLTSVHAHGEGREEDIEGRIPGGEEGAENVEKTGGSTSGGPGGQRVPGDKPNPGETKFGGDDDDRPNPGEFDFEEEAASEEDEPTGS